MLVRSAGDAKGIAYAQGVQKRVVIGPRDGAPNFVMRIFDLEPGANTARHAHDFEHEVLVLSGRGVLIDGEGGETPLQPMDAIFIAPDETHSLRNAGSETLQFVCLVPSRGEDTP
jgi:quercetin dioxygenase-like cupin family protein